MPVQQTFTAWRNATWGPRLTYVYAGAVLPPIAHIAMQLRLYPGAAGDPALSLAAIDHADADNGDGTRTLTLSPSVTAAQLAALPGLNEPEAGSPQTFSFDIRITYSDTVSELLAFGDFILQPGVTSV